LVLRPEFGVDFVPVLGVLWFVGFVLPSRDVASDEFSPDLGVNATKLWGSFLEFSLRSFISIELQEGSTLIDLPVGLGSRA